MRRGLLDIRVDEVVAGKKTTKKLQFRQHRLDPCIFILSDSNNRTVGIIGSHVDDMIGGFDKDYQHAIQEISSEFNLKE